MYRVILVDDEVISRLGILNLINWEENDFVLLDSFVNGQEALEFLKKEQVDLVITDIKMPILDGIELIKEVKDHHIDCEFIILSSFDDYVYVREALNLGAIDYLLKMELDEEHLLSALNKAKEKMLLKENNEPKIEQVDKRTLIRARREFLKQLLYGRKKIDYQFKNDLNKYDILLPYNRFYVLMFKIDHAETQLLDEKVIQVIEDLLMDYEYGYICETGYDELSIIFNFDSNSKQSDYKIIHRLGNRLIFIMKQYFNQQSTIYISKIQHKIDDIPLAYLQACQAMSMKNVVSNEQLIFYEKAMENRCYRDYQTFENYIQQFETSFEQIQVEKVKDVLDELIDYINKTKYVELNQMKYFMATMIYIVNNYLGKYQISKDEFWEEEEYHYQLLKDIRRKEDFILFLSTLKEKLLVAYTKDDNNHLIRAVKKYLNQHYKENIALGDLATEFDVTYTYLSMLFKKQTGETLKDYLTNLKIEKAKELLSNTTNHICEIAKYIGYDNEHYFSRIFKQKTSMTPTEYRNSTYI